MTEFVTAMNAEGLLTVSQAANEVRCSANTLRRAEAKGWISPQRRSWGDRRPMRLYRKADLPDLLEALRGNGFRFADEETLTTADVALRLGVTESTVRKWERDGKIPVAQRDTNGRRLYTDAEREAIRFGLAEVEHRDQEVSDAEGVVTREQAIDLLGIGKTSMRRLVTAGLLVPRETMLPSKGKRQVQVFEHEAVERLRVWLDEGGRVVDAVRDGAKTNAVTSGRPQSSL